MEKASRKKKGCLQTRFGMKTMGRGAEGRAGGSEGGAGREQSLRKED